MLVTLMLNTSESKALHPAADTAAGAGPNNTRTTIWLRHQYLTDARTTFVPELRCIAQAIILRSRKGYN